VFQDFHVIIGVGFPIPARTKRPIVRQCLQKCARSHECVAVEINSVMLRDIPKQQDVLPMSHATPIALDAPLVASPNQAMRVIQVSRKKLYELINTGELESYTEGKSRRITVRSINEYIERRLAAEAARRGHAASDRNRPPRP
jgi:excisionase family DNA binding protein